MIHDRESLPERIRCLIDAIEGCDELTPARTRQLLADAVIEAEDLAPWADFDHPPTDSYGRKLLHDGGCFELMVMSWQPGDMSALHDHGFTQWGAVRLFGEAEHAMFKASDGRLRTVERKLFAAGSVVAVNNDLVHQMGNPGETPFLSLHLYGCYEREGDITADARIYELDQAVVQRTSGGVFFDLPESAVPRTEPCPEPDFATHLRHQVELLKRLNTAHEHGMAAETSIERRSRLIEQLFDGAYWQRGVDAHSELDSDTAKSARELDIFVQELRAACRLQASLRKAGLGSGLEANALEALLTFDDAAFVDAYWQALGSVLELNVPVAA